MSTTIDTCEDMFRTLEECQLVPEEQLVRARSFREASPEGGPKELATYLIEQGLTTRFQADALLRGAGNQLVVGEYTLVDTIGAGSMGAVFKGKNARDGAWYAIKSVPRRNILNLTAITDKVRKCRQLDGGRVSALVHLEVKGERVFLVWPFVEGGEKLDDILKRVGRLPAKQVMQIGLQATLCLSSYHQVSLVHGLIKPSDVVIGADKRIRVMDFGVGFLLTSNQGKSSLSTTTNGKAMAKGLDCASPESIDDPQNRTARGDQYSLGCVLYFCLTGQPPFPGSNPVKKMLGHQSEQPTPIRELVPDAPAKLVAVVNRMMSKDPEDRYSDLAEVAKEIQAAINEPHQAAQARSLIPKPSESKHASSPASAPRPARQAEAPSKTRPSPREARKPRGKPHRLAGALISILGVAAGLGAGLLYWYLSR